MKYVYVIMGQSTGCNGGVIQWADAAYVDAECVSLPNVVILGMVLIRDDYMLYYGGVTYDENYYF